MAVNLSPVGGVAAQFFTNTGAVLTGGKLFTYLAGTTTPAATYTSSSGNIAWTNPIVLDAAGRVPGSGEIWLTDGLLYKFVLKDANDVLIATYDNISGINSNFVAFVNQQEIVTATAGQTVFNLGISYQPATNSLSVFVDGVNQYGPGAQYSYVETDSNTVTFNTGLHVGAEVKFTTTQQQGAGAVDAQQVTYDPPFSGSVVTNVEAKLAQYVSVKDFGAVGDGLTDDTAAIQAAVNANLSGGQIYFPPGTYKITATINKLMSNVGPSFIGAGFNQTVFNYSSLTTESPCLYIQGGSGYLASIVIKGIGFEGNRSGASDGTAAIQIDGQCGVLIQECEFKTNKYGVYFYNKTAGAFTEYCVAENCHFTSACGIKLYYNINAGDASFHGSGARNCTFNVDTAITNYPCVVVEDGCTPYNAPLSTQLWSTGASTVVLIRNNNTGTANCYWLGALTLESLNVAAPIKLAEGTGRSFYVGSVASLNESWERGTLVLCNEFSGQASGEGNASLLPVTTRQTGVTTGTAITFNPVYLVGGSDTQLSQSYLVQVRLVAANYQYTHICAVSYAGGAGGSDTISVLATTQSFNTTGWGASTLTLNGNGQLVVTNASAGFSVTAYVGLTPIGAAIWN